jgi:hypothetical protein
MSQTLSPIGIGHEQAVRVSLKFLKWQELYEIEKPFQIFIDIPKDAEDQRNTNLVFEAVDINIFNVRDCLQDLSIDTHGFMYRTHPTALKEFTDRPSVEALYLPEVEKILRDELDDVDRVFFFDWRASLHPQSTSRWFAEPFAAQEERTGSRALGN